MMDTIQQKKNNTNSPICSRACDSQTAFYRERFYILRSLRSTMRRYEVELQKLGYEIDDSEKAIKEAIPNLISDLIKARKKRTPAGAIASLLDAISKASSLARRNRDYSALHKEMQDTVGSIQKEYDEIMRKISVHEQFIRENGCKCRRTYNPLEWGT